MSFLCNSGKYFLLESYTTQSESSLSLPHVQCTRILPVRKHFQKERVWALLFFISDRKSIILRASSATMQSCSSGWFLLSCCKWPDLRRCHSASVKQNTQRKNEKKTDRGAKRASFCILLLLHTFVTISLYHVPEQPDLPDISTSGRGAEPSFSVALWMGVASHGKENTPSAISAG